MRAASSQSIRARKQVAQLQPMWGALTPRLCGSVRDIPRGEGTPPTKRSIHPAAATSFRQDHFEPAPLPRRARRSDRAAVAFGDAAHNRQADSASFVTRIQPLERPEDPLRLLRREANPVIRHREMIALLG